MPNPNNPEPHSHSAPVSQWVARFAPLIAKDARVLDIAAGRGRHTRYFLERGAQATAVDRDVSRLEDIRGRAEIVEADLENDAPWPFGGRRFDAVVVTSYLYRPLFPALLAAVAPDGILLYETYALDHEHYGRPRNPEYLLRPNELLEVISGHLHVIAYETGLEERDYGLGVTQRICARKGAAPMMLPRP